MNNMDRLLPQGIDTDTQAWAAVTALSPLRIKLDGESAALPFTPDTLVAPLAVNDRVRVAFSTNDDPAFRGQRVVVVGVGGGAEKGRLLTVANLSAENALTGVSAGFQVYRTDLKRVRTHDGTRFMDPPGTLLRYGNRVTDKTYSGTEVGVLQIDDEPVYAGYAYRVVAAGLRMSVATTGDTGLAIIRYTTDGSTPTTSSTIMAKADANADSPFLPAQTKIIDTIHRPGSDQTLSLWLTLSRSGGAGNITMAGTANPIELEIYLVGIDPGDTGVDL